MKIMFALLLLFCFSCKTNNTATQTATEVKTEFAPVFTSGPPVLVYKTKGHYDNLVPDVLSEDKSEIVSYPHPSDISVAGEFTLPVDLNNGYLLDMRGIGKNTAFLKLSYEDYSKLDSVPSLKELYALIIDKDPFTELCNCGIKTAFTDQTKQLNELIDGNKLRTLCKVIK